MPKKNRLGQTSKERSQAGLGDIEYASKYLGRLDKDPVARIGFDPSRIHYGEPGLNIHGVYIRDMPAESDRHKKERALLI